MKKPQKPLGASGASAAETGDLVRFSRAVALSVGAGALVTFLILCVFSALMSVRDLPHSAVVPISILAVAAGAVFSGWCCAKINREKGLLWGLCCGTVLYLLAFFCELMLLGQPIGILALYKYIIYAASGMIGGVLGVNQRRRGRPRGHALHGPCGALPGYGAMVSAWGLGFEGFYRILAKLV